MVTGRLSVRKLLDHEMQDTYELKIIARDSGTPPRTTTQILTVHVDDVNDNSPEFSQDKYEVHIQENAPQRKILTLVAEDADSGMY